MWTQEMFGVEKPIIALLHLDALPGDPGYCGSMETVLEHARQDLVALQNGGVDGILFANEFSLPYQPVADIAVISSMAARISGSSHTSPACLRCSDQTIVSTPGIWRMSSSEIVSLPVPYHRNPICMMCFVP